MTDYGEEQRNELEALESIYPDSFTGDFRGRVPAAVPGWGGMGREGPEPPPSASRATTEKGTVGPPRRIPATLSSGSPPEVFRHFRAAPRLLLRLFPET